MLLIVIVNLATLVIIIGGIFNATQSAGKPHWLYSKKFIRASVLASAIVAFGVNVYQSQQDEQHKHSLLSKLDPYYN
ncbi:hypothetical protein C6A37_07225 [Desulfobacteraceae bacterium SEEP-SAG9]|nr:hypothetical protein C6A37_07225 [Desulfobacteraceae bacterium SEEP-SAG9]